MGTFTWSYFLRKSILERPKWKYVVYIVGPYLYYRYHYTKRRIQLTAMKGHTRMYESRRKEILAWDKNADIWFF